MSRRAPRRPGYELAPGYEVVEHIHRSNAFDVYDVWSSEREARCIVKALRPERLAEPAKRRKLLAEGRLLQSLDHPGIVRAYETITHPEPLIVMETLTGETVAHLVDRRLLTGRELAFLGLQLSSAVGYLHRRGFVHLDLKPSNIVAESGRAKLIDLSIARRPGRARRPGVGTWCYMAPEQVRGGNLKPAADVWGIAVVLWEAATGRPAFGNDADLEHEGHWSESELPIELHPQIQRTAEPVRRHRRLPARLAQAIDACLAPEPSQRPTVSELAVLLAQVPGVLSPRSRRPG